MDGKTLQQGSLHLKIFNLLPESYGREIVCMASLAGGKSLDKAGESLDKAGERQAASERFYISKVSTSSHFEFHKPHLYPCVLS